MTASRLQPVKQRQVVEWEKLWGALGKVEQAERDNRELFLKWELLRCVMASKATQILELPEHPKVLEVRNYIASLGYGLNEWGDETTLVGQIVDRLRARIPEIRHAYKEEDLPAWIRYVTYVQLSASAPDDKSKKAFDEEGARAIELKIERLLPNNPLPLDEAILKNYTPDQIRKAGFELGDLARARQPARPVGRPKKPSSEKPAKVGARSLDSTVAARAYQMSLDKQHWVEIARACYPNLSAAARRSNKMRVHIGRLIEKGRLNAKKSARNN
jgi:hypothetical protein